MKSGILVSSSKDCNLCVRAPRLFVKCRTLICHAPAPCTGRIVGEIDVAKTLQRSTFPLKPEELVAKAKNVIATMFGTLDNDVLADDFRFVAPVVGPLVGIHARMHARIHMHAHSSNSFTRARVRSLALSLSNTHEQGKDEFLRIFGSFKLEDALPDLQENHWGFHVDPLEPNRVWCVSLLVCWGWGWEGGSTEKECALCPVSACVSPPPPSLGVREGV